MTIKPGNPARKQKSVLHAHACSLCRRCTQHHPHPLLPSGSGGLEAILSACVSLFLDYTFKDRSEHECVLWMWNNWGIFKASTVLLLVITPLRRHQVADILFLYEGCLRFLVPVFNLTGAAAKLKTVPQQCCCVSHFHSHFPLVQPKQAVFKENLGAGGARSKTKAAVKYWCHKLHRLWISQSHSFLSQLKNCWRLAANYLAHGGRW